MTETINPTLTKIEDLFKTLVWDNAINAFLTWLFTAAPWLNIWPLKPIVAGVTNLILNKFYGFMVLFADLKAAKIINENHRRSFEKASVVLALIARDKGIESEEYKNARNDAKEHFKSLIVYNGVGVK